MSKMSKHTPGPWIVRPKRYLDTRRRVGPADNEFFDVSYSSGNSNAESEANAYLIAAAPSLYEEVRETIFFLENFDPSNREYEVVRRTRLNFLKGSIAKARGES